MSKGAGKQTVTNAVDPATAARQTEIWNRAQQVSNQPYTPYGGQQVAGASDLSTQGVQGTQGAMGQYQNLYNQNLGFGSQLQPYQQAGAQGAAALGGDQNAIHNMMNPYMQNVMDANNTQFNQLRGQAHMQSNDQATQQGAFGGSRQGVMEGTRLGQIDQAQGMANANLLQSGYNNAMGFAGQAANLGLGANGQQLGAYGQAGQAAQGGQNAAGQVFGQGDYFRQMQQQQLDAAKNSWNDARDWDANRLGILQSGLGGPSGTTQTQPLTKNVGAGILGGAATGAAIGGPIGAGIGGFLGLF